MYAARARKVKNQIVRITFRKPVAKSGNRLLYSQSRKFSSNRCRQSGNGLLRSHKHQECKRSGSQSSKSKLQRGLEYDRIRRSRSRQMNKTGSNGHYHEGGDQHTNVSNSPCSTEMSSTGSDFATSPDSLDICSNPASTGCPCRTPSLRVLSALGERAISWLLQLNFLPDTVCNRCRPLDTMTNGIRRWMVSILHTTSGPRILPF